MLEAETQEAPETKQAYRNGFEDGFEIGKAQCETHHEDMKAEAASQAREDENKRIVKILEDYRFGLDYPDCPPGDVIKKLVDSIKNGRSEKKND